MLGFAAKGERKTPPPCIINFQMLTHRALHLILSDS